MLLYSEALDRLRVRSNIILFFQFWAFKQLRTKKKKTGVSTLQSEEGEWSGRTRVEIFKYVDITTNFQTAFFAINLQLTDH